jgi:hypothetical protein
MGMAVYRPDLDDISKRVLRVIREHGVAPGWQVMSETSITSEQLVNSATILIGMGLIKVSGGGLNVKEVDSAYFNILPSNAKLSEFLVS